MAAECIFCRIVKGEIPCFTVFEDSSVLAFLDIGPVNFGHTLVITKKHYADFLDMPEKAIAHVFTAAQKIAPAVMKGTSAGGFNIGMNNRKASGQIVFHAHLHIIPRFEGDGLKLWPGKRYNEGEAEKVKDSIRKSL